MHVGVNRAEGTSTIIAPDRPNQLAIKPSTANQSPKKIIAQANGHRWQCDAKSILQSSHQDDGRRKGRGSTNAGGRGKLEVQNGARELDPQKKEKKARKIQRSRAK
ncbi:hypothetical protein Rcae01_00701 [Novipirellula caenicola]|uniref:Uncharacterized protein n=1 Tax=Novipirellula caenicola TaxID=1536901 RepID=A0ABP9VJ72_9BACT